MATLPEPSAYALMTFHERGQVCAALSRDELWQYATQYAAFLDTLLDGTNARTDPRTIVAQMYVCVLGWRGRQAAQGCDVADAEMQERGGASKSYHTQ